jgi:hypothetical protein
MKKIMPIFAAWIALAVCAEAQVSFSARVFFPPERHIDIMFLMPKGFCLTVDGEDTVRYTGCDSTATVRYDNIPVGSRCRFFYRDFGELYTCPVFTITADTNVDSLVLRRDPSKEEVFWTKIQKDTTLQNRAARWGSDVDGRDTFWYEDEFWLDDEPHSLKLARLYYADWIAPLASWRTWPHAADSAYRYLLHAYKQYPYLYYPLRQLAQHLGKPLKAKPPKEPNKHTYLPQPDMPDHWWTDTTADLFTPWEKHDWENTYARDHTLGKAGEKSLCYPLAADGTMRYIESNPLSGVAIYRIENGRLYYFRLGGKGWKLTDKDSYTLTAEELDSVANAVAAFQHAGRPEDERGLYVIDGSTFVLEYITDGHYHRYTTSSGAVPPQLEAIIELLIRRKND